MVSAGEIDEPQAQKALGDVGFTPEMQQAPVSTLSGGWKMKLALGEPLAQYALEEMNFDLISLWVDTKQEYLPAGDT